MELFAEICDNCVKEEQYLNYDNKLKRLKYSAPRMRG